MSTDPFATFKIECTDLIDGLCRVLDQVRRMGIALHTLSASADHPGGVAEFVARSATAGDFEVLADRVRQMNSVSSVAVLPAQEPDRRSQPEASLPPVDGNR